jgi:biopolymer transport protein ExbD
LFFTTALLLFLHSQVVFTPGVRLDLHPITETNRPSLYIDSESLFHYQGSRMSQASFVKRIRADAEKGKVAPTLILQTDDDVSTNALKAVRELAADLSFAIEPPGTRIELPEASDQPGAKGPSVIVAVNMSGQFFYETGFVRSKADLERKLITAQEKSREPLTLVLRLDKAVTMEVLTQLSEMAQRAGFRDVILSTRPPLKPVDSATN